MSRSKTKTKIKQEESVRDRNLNFKSFNDFKFSIPPPADDAISASANISQIMHSMFGSFLKQHDKSTLLAKKIITEGREKLIKLIGAERYYQVVDYNRKQRLNDYGLKKFRDSDDYYAKLIAAKRKVKDYVKSLMKNISQEKIDQINQETIQKLTAIRKPKNQTASVEIVDASKVPEAILTGKTNPWTIRTTPFDGEYVSCYWSRSGGSDPEFTYYNNSATGRIGSRAEYENYSASDGSTVYTNVFDGIGIWFNVEQKPKDTIEIWAKARCDRFQYNFWLDDEFGFSDSDTVTNSYFDLWICPSGTPNTGFEIPNLGDIIEGTWWKHVAGSPDSKTYSGNFESPDTERWIHYKFKFPYKPYAGWWVLWVGTHDLMSTYLNDVSADLRLKNRWFIESIQYEIT